MSASPPPEAADAPPSSDASATREAIRRAASFIADSSGWRRAVIAIAAGAMCALALPPWHLVPLLWIGFVPLVWLLDGAAGAVHPVRRAAMTGFLFGLGYFGLGIHWLAEAFLVDPVRHGWMIPFAVGGLSALLALFPAAACAATIGVCWRMAIFGAGRVLVLAALWVVAEWLRGWVLTGFPWNLVGYAWAFSSEMIQAAAFAGIYGLSLMTVVVAAMPAVLADADSQVVGPGRWRTGVVVPVAIAVLVLPAAYAGGWFRLATAPAYDAAVPGAAIVEGVRLRLVQAGIPQRLKWRPDLRTDNLMRHVALSRSDSVVSPTHVIWPETAVPFSLPNDARVREIAATSVPPGGLLITGSVRYEGQPGGDRRYWNSAVALSPNGDIVAQYDKTHLVPFGEYVPLGNILPLQRLVVGAGDFTAGPGFETLALPGLPSAGPLICYEAIFPAAVTASGRRPEWLLNLTNDGWFGGNAGPRQHLAIAAMRAVEEGLPMIRVAGTGISAVIDPFGREIGRLDIGETGVLDSVLPRPLAPTIYARYENIVPAALVVISLVVAGRWRRQ